MLKISDKTVKLLLNYNYLFWGPLFIGTHCRNNCIGGTAYRQCDNKNCWYGTRYAVPDGLAQIKP